MTRPSATLLALAVSLIACSSAEAPSTASTADAQRPQAEAPADSASAKTKMPAAREYLALTDPRYGHHDSSPGAPTLGDKVGEGAQDFELPTHDGGSFRLSEAVAEGPVFLMFYRGFW